MEENESLRFELRKARLLIGHQNYQEARENVRDGERLSGYVTQEHLWKGTSSLVSGICLINLRKLEDKAEEKIRRHNIDSSCNETKEFVKTKNYNKKLYTRKRPLW